MKSEIVIFKNKARALTKPCEPRLEKYGIARIPLDWFAEYGLSCTDGPDLITYLENKDLYAEYGYFGYVPGGEKGKEVLIIANRPLTDDDLTCI